MDHFYLTDPGKVRDHNEDSVIILENSTGDILMAIADGMGGHSAGEVASSIAIGYLGKHFKETFIHLTKVNAVNWIRDAVEEINTLIFQHEKTHPESKGMGTTLVMAVITDNYILMGNVGDSSGFVIKDLKLRKVTYDHTLVNLLVSAGELTKEDIAGTMDITNRADNTFSVNRDEEAKVTTVRILKNRSEGIQNVQVAFNFDVATKRFSPTESDMFKYKKYKWENENYEN